MDICKNFAFSEMVKQPTREDPDHLLDLVLTNNGTNTKTKLLPKMADHLGVLTTISTPFPQEIPIKRTVWCYDKAKWDNLRKELGEVRWNLNDDLHVAAEFITDTIKSIAEKHIPRKEITEQKRSHPWINERCKSALSVQNASKGTPEHEEKTAICTAIFREELENHIKKLQEQIRTLPRGSKEWWRINKELLHNAPCRTTTPSLRNHTGEWIHSPKEKANLFRQTFANKSVLPPEAHLPQPTQLPSPPSLAQQTGAHSSTPHCPNLPSPTRPDSVSTTPTPFPTPHHPNNPTPTHHDPLLTFPAPHDNQPHTPTISQTCRMSAFNLIRIRWTLRILKQLDPDSATGPDQIPARILKQCAREPALPITLLARLMLSNGC